MFMVSIDDVAVARTAARHRLEAARRVLSRPKCGEAGQQALGLEAATRISTLALLEQSRIELLVGCEAQRLEW